MDLEEVASITAATKNPCANSLALKNALRPRERVGCRIIIRSARRNRPTVTMRLFLPKTPSGGGGGKYGILPEVLIRKGTLTRSRAFEGKRTHGYLDILRRTFRCCLRSGSFPCVKMMQSADLGNFDHPAKRGRLDRSADRRILAKREVSSKSFVVLEIVLQDAAIRFHRRQ